MDSELSVVLLAASLAGLGGGLWLLVRGFGAHEDATRLADTATSTISSIAVGEVRISGVVEPAELVLRSPLQSETCVYYRARVREGDRGERRTVMDEVRAVGFRVRDASGEIRVFPRGAAFDVPLRFDDADDGTGMSPPGLAPRYGPAVEPGTPDRESLVAQLLTVRPSLGHPGSSGTSGSVLDPGTSASFERSLLDRVGLPAMTTGRRRREYEEARIQPGETVTIVGTALPFDQLPDPDGADLADGGDGYPGAMVPPQVALQDPEIAADVAAARAAGILETDPEEAWGNAAIPGFGIGLPVREPELDDGTRALPIADAPTAERFERTFEIDPAAIILAATPDRPLLISAGSPSVAIARHEDRFLLGLLGAALAIASAIALGLQLGGIVAP